MKICLIIANCFSWEIVSHLRGSKKFCDEYEIRQVSTYLQKPDENYVRDIGAADIVITQNVKSIPEYTHAFIQEHVKKDALFVKTEFWRFDGFWNYASPDARKSNWFWYPANEFGSDLSFDDYMSYPLNKSELISHFDAELEKLKGIDEMSDVKIFDLFMQSYKKERVFSDHWHPMPIFFKHVVDYVFSNIGIDDGLQQALPATRTNADRYRIITNSANEILGIEDYPKRNELHFMGKNITTEEYYNFSKFIMERKLLEDIKNMTHLREHFQTFRGEAA